MHAYNCRLIHKNHERWRVVDPLVPFGYLFWITQNLFPKSGIWLWNFNCHGVKIITLISEHMVGRKWSTNGPSLAFRTIYIHTRLASGAAGYQGSGSAQEHSLYTIHAYLANCNRNHSKFGDCDMPCECDMAGHTSQYFTDCSFSKCVHVYMSVGYRSVHTNYDRNGFPGRQWVLCVNFCSGRFSILSM